MKPGTKVMTPDGKGEVIEPIGTPPDKSKPILVSLNKMVNGHFNWYYSKTELKVA